MDFFNSLDLKTDFKMETTDSYHPVFEKILRVAGPVFFLCMQVASINVSRRILEAQSSLGLSVLPFLSMFTNCLVWVCYGFLRNDYTLLVPNGCGVTVGLYCSCVFHYYCHDKKPFILYGVSLLLICTAVYFASIRDEYHLGVMGCSLATILMGSPLATLGTVIRDRSTATLPLWPSVFTWMNAFSWSLYGHLIAKDIMVSFFRIESYSLLTMMGVTTVIHLKKYYNPPLDCSSEFHGTDAGFHTATHVHLLWLSACWDQG